MRLKTHVMTFAAVISASLILSDSPANAKGKPGGGGGDGGIILGDFTFAFEDLSGNIYVSTIDDSQRVKLASSKGGELGSAAWSPNLSLDPDYQGLVAYLDFQSDRRDLYVTDGNQTRLVRSFTAADPLPSELDRDLTLAWTPNGQEIVFASKSNLIVAIQVATGNLRILLDFSGDLGPDVQDVTVSPSEIAYRRQGDIWSAAYDINTDGLIEVDATSAINLTDTPNTAEQACSLSRDGSYLAYSRLLDRWEIVVLDLMTMEEIVVLEELGGRREVAWSPDSSELAIHDVGASSKSGQRVIDLFRITNWADPVNRTVIRVTNTDKSSDERYPDWRPGALEL